jgi:hypothetical protein
MHVGIPGDACGNPWRCMWASLAMHVGIHSGRMHSSDAWMPQSTHPAGAAPKLTPPPLPPLPPRPAGAAPELDRTNLVVARVVSGMEVVAQLAALPFARPRDSWYDKVGGGRKPTCRAWRVGGWPSQQHTAPPQADAAPPLPRVSCKLLDLPSPLSMRLRAHPPPLTPPPPRAARCSPSSRRGSASATSAPWWRRRASTGPSSGQWWARRASLPDEAWGLPPTSERPAGSEPVRAQCWLCRRVGGGCAGRVCWLVL